MLNSIILNSEFLILKMYNSHFLIFDKILSLGLEFI
nr:MAG TPA: hypothetical protein [Caudoviricetes sp.]